MRLHIDFETRSTVDLRRAGVYRYAEDPTTDVIVVCWALDEGPVHTWYHHQQVPLDLMTLLADKRVTVVAHNAGFERLMLEKILGPRYGWVVPEFDRWDCTAARAARMALPRSLDGAAQALGLNVTKDIEGQRLMMRMCRPRAVFPANEARKMLVGGSTQEGQWTTASDGGLIQWWADRERMQRLAQYCATDVDVERGLDKTLRHLTPDEREIWLLTEEINDRGVCIDVDFAEHAVVLAQEAQALLNAEITRLTDGMVMASSNVAGIKRWLLSRGFALFEGDDDSLNKKAIENLLARDIPADVRRVLEIRLEGGKSSVAKYQAMADRVSGDGRVRGNLMYHGASTGRWAGAGVQLQNLPRATVKDWDAARETLEPIGPETVATLSKMIRGTIKAEEGKRLIWADYAAIEARGVAWLAGQTDLIDLFATGGKVYEEMAGVIFDKPASEIGKNSLERFVGKTVVLGCGYSMGPLKFRQTCIAQGTEIDEDLANKAVKSYRSNYNMIPRLWDGLNDACLNAIMAPGLETYYRDVRFMCADDWLMIRLPSGRKLYYRSPRIVTHSGPFGMRPAIEYMAVNSLTKKWQPERTFGGKLTENIVQGLCRDIIAGAMLALQRHGYPVIASVHDEVICEVPLGYGTQDEMVEIMCQVPDWAAGFPIAAEASEGIRYGK